MIRKIFVKELIDTLRDKRTLMMMLVIPILVFPIILNVFVGVSTHFQEEAANKMVYIGITGDSDHMITDELKAIPEVFGDKKLIIVNDSTELKTLINKDSIQFGIQVYPSFKEDIQQQKTAQLSVYYKGTELGMQDRAEAYLEIVENNLKRNRLDELHIDETKITPVNIAYANVASEKEMIGTLAGGILPYIFIAFGFIGCMYPAIDLFTGEKERGTLETLLTTPVARWKILFGKMGVVVLSGLLAASCSLLGLFISIEVFDIVKDPELLGIIHSALSPTFVLLMFTLLIPLTIFFAGVMIPIAVYAKTFKEAQSIITPLNIVMVLPAMIGFFPGIKLDMVTASIPVINVVLATKELISGTLDYGLLIWSFVVMMCFAILAITISYKRFDKETNVVV